MTLAEYLAELLKEKGITKVFAIQGGGSARLIDAIGEADGIDYICNQHEQASAMSADGYARASGKIACAISTSGPGATNMLTGACGAYFDSIPILFITGQVSSFRLKKDIKVRNMHTQETDVVDIFKPVTKYAVALRDPYDIKYEIEKCVFYATNGRPGPVLIDIPDDFQRTEIDEKKLKSFDPGTEIVDTIKDDECSILCEAIFDGVKESVRPIIIAGWGIHAAGAEESFRALVDKLNIPVVFTWGGNDILSDNHRLKIGTLGMNGTSAGNRAVKEADYIIILGARMDQHTIIGSLDKFACRAKKALVDIDGEEINKFAKHGCDIDIVIRGDLYRIIPKLVSIADDKKCSEKNFAAWTKSLIDEKQACFEKKNENHSKDRKVSPYKFIHTLSRNIEENALIYIDTGSSLVWMEQSFAIKKGQRMHSSLNNTPMGYSLPAAIGGALYTGGRVYSINGDGGIQMNIQELSTVIRHNLDIKIILFDNAGYGMVQRTQDTYMGSRYHGTDVISGLAFPDFEKLFKAYGFDVTVIEDDSHSDDLLKKAFSHKGPGCVIVRVSLDENYETFHAEDIE